VVVAITALIVTAALATIWLRWWNGGMDLDRGAALYAVHCASCHGGELEGEEDWKSLGDDGLLPAPPHDETGHTWHHSDGLLFSIVKEGSAAVIGDGYESNMPPFADVLTDEDIWTILDFLKSRWPAREREFQEQISQQEN
jgi:mono/diheme cytochrome c family protein